MKIYANGSIVSLAIPSKLRLKPEARRLLCRITKVVKNRYTLICFAGPIKGSHNAGQLNEVLSPDKSSIPLKFQGWKKAKLTIAKAVAKTNNRGSIAAAQKANQLANKALLGQADDNSDDNSDDHRDDNELTNQQLLDQPIGQFLDRPLGLTGPLLPQIHQAAISVVATESSRPV